MSVFKKRETLVQNIAYMALMAAINVIFVLLTTFVPVLFFLIVFVLPLTSTIVALHCKKKYFPIYAVVTIGLCMLCTIWKIDDTIFYVIPSIISGFIFAIMVEKGIPAPWIIIATTIVQMAFAYLAVPFITWVFGRNIITTFASIFKLQDYQYLDYVVPVAIFFLSLVQCVLSYIVINEEIKKFGFETKETNLLSIQLLLGLLTAVLMTVIFALTYKPLSYAFLSVALYFTCFLVAGLLQEKKIWIYISLGVALLITFFTFAICYSYIPVPLGLLMVGVFFVLVGIIVFIDNCLLKRKNKDTI